MVARNVTFEECFNDWTREYYDKVIASSKRTIDAAYLYCSKIYGMKMWDIRSYHLKDLIDTAYRIESEGKNKGKKKFASPTVKARIKSVLNLMFDYALEHEIVDKNYARNFKLDSDIRKEAKNNKREIHIFTKKEIEELWEDQQYGFTDMILIDLYSGWRPQELATLIIEDVDLEKNVIRGGMKTEAGRNRIVPFHPEILPLIKNRMKEARMLNSDYLFNDSDGQ